MTKLEYSGCDGSHNGLTDWYEGLENAIVQALALSTPKSEWTTGWYSSKKEIASAKISCENGQIIVEASVSDDFDTEGYGRGFLPLVTTIEEIHQKIYEVWDEAEENQKDNRLYEGYSILTEITKKDYNGKRMPFMAWVETYIAPRGDGYIFDEPPGDNYGQWGFQGEYEIPEDIKKAITEWIEEDGEGEAEFGKFKVKSWETE